ncbi:MAG TPA: murein L,D-transpeptidase catalytic domain family protein [Puia sp.]|nr:murein L,D-transpeptidase catalytic domain family protein [Puia sp.]
MRRRNLKPLVWCVWIAFLLPVNVALAGGGTPVRTHSSAAKAAREAALAEEVTILYEQFNLQEIGLTKKAFHYALKGYHYLLDHHWLNNPNILSICDMSQSSRNKRLYVLDMENKTVVVNTYVAHGRASGGEFARSFSNSPSSRKSSLGFYVTEDTYYGSNGLSLRIKGMERGFNDRAFGRGIVVHGSEYVGPDFLQMNQFCGRSYGCPAVPADESENIIDLIKEGSCLFIYYPTPKYIVRSKILNY